MSMLLPTSENLRRIILANAPALQERMPWANAVAVLGALAEVESSFGLNAVPRYERIFDYGGRYYSPELCYTWGAWACCSYGSFQIMYPVAVELGFDPKRSPAELWNDDVGIHWVMEYINRRIIGRGAHTIREFADGYNSGNFKDGMVPTSYIAKFEMAYAGVIERRNLKTEVLSA